MKTPVEQPQLEDVKALQEQIDHDQNQTPKPAEKRVKVDEKFDVVLKRMGQTPAKRD